MDMTMRKATQGGLVFDKRAGKFAFLNRSLGRAASFAASVFAALALNSARADTLISTNTYSYTGSAVNYTVPASTNYLIVKAWGAGGGDWVGYLYGGAGGFAQGQISASPGGIYVVEVGGGGIRNAGGAGAR